MASPALSPGEILNRSFTKFQLIFCGIYLPLSSSSRLRHNAKANKTITLFYPRRDRALSKSMVLVLGCFSWSPRSFSAGRLWQAFSRVVWRPDVSRAGPQFKQKKISRFFRIPVNMVILGPFLASMLSKSLKFCTILI